MKTSAALDMNVYQDGQLTSFSLRLKQTAEQEENKRGFITIR